MSFRYYATIATSAVEAIYWKYAGSIGQGMSRLVLCCLDSERVVGNSVLASSVYMMRLSSQADPFYSCI